MATKKIEPNATKTCDKCNRNLKVTHYYKCRDGSYTSLCKACLTSHIDVFDSQTYEWILEEMDFPYVKKNWQTVRTNSIKTGKPISATNIFGKYLKTLRLSFYKNYGYADSDLINRKEGFGDETDEERRERDERLQQKFENGEISEAVYKTLVSEEKLEEFRKRTGVNLLQEDNQPHPKATKQEPKEERVVIADNEPIDEQAGNPFDESVFLDEDEIPDLGKDLTKEDKIYLAVKWGRLYKPNDWITMEKNYEDLKQGYGIEDPDSLMSLVTLCKANLEVNKAIEERRFDDYNKIFKSTVDLRKTLNVTAQQSKEEKTLAVDTLGKLVAFCEKNKGRIPKFKVTAPQDIVDEVLNDIVTTTTSIIKEDPSIANKIEEYLKKKQVAKKEVTFSKKGDTRIRAERESKLQKEIEAENEKLRQIQEDERNSKTVTMFDQKKKQLVTLDRTLTSDDKNRINIDKSIFDGVGVKKNGIK